MKFSNIVFAIGSIAVTTSSAFQNLQSFDTQLNISSPIVNGVYVVGQILPLTYIPATSANLRLDIYLRGLNASSNETTIAKDADVSNNSANAVSDPVTQTVYYQHSINYDIPPTTPSGEYEVIYHNANANANTTIPISILPYVVPSSTNISLAHTATVLSSPSTVASSQSSVAVNPTVIAEPSIMVNSSSI